ncbi:MAG: class I SAM-dependent methyltransferase [Firmicutes bacterium]|nr:class I SAM-dependent methyltransferase [Bacillota bacterium]
MKQFLARFLPASARAFHGTSAEQSKMLGKIFELNKNLKQDFLAENKALFSKQNKKLNNLIKIIDEQNEKIDWLTKQFEKVEEHVQATIVHPPTGSYANRRKNMLYYEYISRMLYVLTQQTNSIVDIGSNGVSTLESLTWIPERVSVDISKPYQSKNVQGIKCDFFEFNPQIKYDFATCFQVIEHVENPEKFVSKIFDIAESVLISVPYKWDSGRSHLHHNIDLKTITEWTKRKPHYNIVVDELFVGRPRKGGKASRIICYYHKNDDFNRIACKNMLGSG